MRSSGMVGSLTWWSSETTGVSSRNRPPGGYLTKTIVGLSWGRGDRVDHELKLPGLLFWCPDHGRGSQSLMSDPHSSTRSLFQSFSHLIWVKCGQFGSSLYFLSK